MRRVIVILLILMIIAAPAQAQVTMSPGFYVDENLPIFWLGTTNYTVTASAGFYGGNAIFTSTLGAKLTISVLGSGLTVYRQIAVSRDNTYICLLNDTPDSCETINNIGSTVNNGAYYYDFEAYLPARLPDEGAAPVFITLEKAGTNTNPHYISGFYVHPFDPAPVFATPGPTPTVIAQLPTPDGATIYSTIAPEGTEEPQTVAYRYEWTAGENTIAVLLLGIFMLLLLIFGVLVFQVRR